MRMRVSVNGVAYDVEVEVLDEEADLPSAARPAAPSANAPRPPVAPVAAPAPAPAAGGEANTLASPIPGTIVEILVKPGQPVAANETVIIIDAMKMNTPVAAPAARTVKEVLVKAGDAVKMGQPLLTFE